MRLLDVDPWTGVQEWGSYDAMTDSLTITRIQDVEPILDMNKANYNDMSHWRDQSKNDEIGIDMRHVARIPVIVQEQWLRQYGVDIYNDEHWPKICKLLNDPEWRYLKSAAVRI